MQLLGQTLLSRYKVEQVLGSGGFGDTYLATDIALPKSPKCVVKHLKPKNNSEKIKEIALSLFEREAHTLYELGEHDAIPRLFAHFEQNGEFFLVQEFIDGHDLSQELIPGQSWSSAQVCQLLKELIGILAILHGKQVIHRDVKPQNIMRRNEDGKLFLIDFGAVKEIPQISLTETGETALTVAIGSPGYMPSEQAVGKPKPSSDLYSVGMIAIQALTGQYPQELPINQSTGELIWQAKQAISPNLDSFIRTLTQDHFSQRYVDAVEALQMLENLLQGNNINTTVQTSAPGERGVFPESASIPPTEYQPPRQTIPSSKRTNFSKALPWLISGVSLMALGIGSLFVMAPWEGTVTISKNQDRSSSSVTISKNQEGDSSVESNINVSVNRNLGNQPSSNAPSVKQQEPEVELQTSTSGLPQEFSNPTPEIFDNRSNLTTTGAAFVIDPPSNVRATPNGEILCAVPRPQSIAIGPPAGDWFQTSFCNEPGYIHISQLSFENLTALVFDPPSNVRSEPNGTILCAVTQTDVIDTFGETSGWYRTNVCNGSTIGYIHHSQIQLDP